MRQGTDRVFVLSSKGWAVLLRRIRSSFDSGADVILFEMGQHYGGSVALGLKNEDADYEQSIRRLIKRVSFSGWGKVSVSGNLPSGKNLSLRLDNCVFCDGRKSSKPSCHFFRGILSGIAQALYGRSFKVVEEQCTASGNQCCTFVLEEDPFSVYRIEPVIDV
jgi:predicted hydrocarbon binding protein